jgi:hypothetical protein
MHRSIAGNFGKRLTLVPVLKERYAVAAADDGGSYKERFLDFAALRSE